MTEQENHFTVFIRLPFKRGDFVDPPPVSWSATKERELWDVISRQSKGNEVDWGVLAEQFQVSQQFLLQQAAWLYERQLSQVRAQMRRMGSRQSATPSPAPGSAAASMMGTAPISKRPGGLTSRGPSRLSTQALVTTSPAEMSVPSTPARSKTSLPLKSTSSTATGSGTRVQPSSSRPLSRKPSKDNESTSRTHSRRGSIQQQTSKSPADLRSGDLTSSSEDESLPKPVHRRANPATTQKRTSFTRKSQSARTSSLSVHLLKEQQEEDEEEDDPAFLPFADTSAKVEHSAGTSDPSATLRGDLTQHTASTSTVATTSARPSLQRNHTSERIRSVQPSNPSNQNTRPRELHTQFHSHQQQLASSTSSLSSNNSPYPPITHAPRQTAATSAAAAQLPHRSSPSTNNTSLPTPLSPRQQAALAAAAGLSPRRRSTVPSRNHTHTGSESSPSMGSSFSDLDDASVTQSALEEALMSNMNALGSTTGGIGGLGSRVSGISQALRSRYFDARSGTGAGAVGQGEPQR